MKDVIPTGQLSLFVPPRVHPNSRINLAGQQFGRLVALRPGVKVGCQTTWVCRCVCGNEKTIITSSLRDRRTKSCGCLKHDLPMQTQLHDLAGKRFGRLLVIGRHDERTAKGKITWLCCCDCGVEKIVVGGELRSGDTRSCGCLQREKARERCLDPKVTQNTVEKTRGIPRKNVRKYDFNTAFLDEWTRESAYFLGWVVTDGHVDRLSIRFRLKDKDACELLLALAGHPQPPIWRPTDCLWEASFNSVEMSQRAAELGMLSPKTFTTRLPTMPDTCLSHFMRGVIDGDGSVAIHQKRLLVRIYTASKRFAEDILSVAPVRGRVDIRLNPNTEPFYTVGYGCQFAIQMADWIYQDSEGLRLARKFDCYAKARRVLTHSWQFLTWQGETLTLAGWSKRTGINHNTLYARLYRGWSTEDTLSKPARLRRS